jgi:hypothetical protein
MVVEVDSVAVAVFGVAGVSVVRSAPVRASHPSPTRTRKLTLGARWQIWPCKDAP